jgi:large conductance mechanosensitive channel
MLTGGVDFNDKKFVLKDAIDAVNDGAGKIITPAIVEVSIKYGSFITNLLDFVIVAFAVFMVIKGINKMKKEEPALVAEAPVVSSTDALLIEIRDSLKK